jgi:branched-chain amino acid transport system permease protein
MGNQHAKHEAARVRDGPRSFGGLAGGMFSAIQGFISPESFVLVESIMVLSMVVLGGMGNIFGVILGALLLSFVPEVLRYTVGPGAASGVRR